MSNKYLKIENQIVVYLKTYFLIPCVPFIPQQSP